MRRREFIALLGSGVAGWPLALRAQQAAKLPTIGFLGANNASFERGSTDAFVQRLRELGWIDNRTVAIEYRWAEGREARFAEIATEFVRLKVDVIFTYATPSSIAAKRATAVIPIVFAAAGDPVGSGLVASLARPGGNITGLSIQQTDLASKRLEILRELLPGLRAGDPGRYRRLKFGFGKRRGADGSQRARPRYFNIGSPESGRYRARVRRAQGPGGGTLCMRLATSNDEPNSSEQLSVRRATANHARLSRICSGGRADVLWTKFPKPFSSCR